MMEAKELRALLEGVAAGEIEIDTALLELKKAPFEDLGFAKPDYHRSLRQGLAELIYGAGKTPEQIRDIAARMRSQGQRTVLITRMRPEAAETLRLAGLPLQYDPACGVGIVGEVPPPDGRGTIVVATGGTSDIPVAEEAAKTAERITREFKSANLAVHIEVSVKIAAAE